MKMTGRGVISKLGPLDVNGSPAVPATGRRIHQISRVARFAIGNPCPPGLAHVPRSTAPLSASRRLHLQPLKMKLPVGVDLPGRPEEMGESMATSLLTMR